MFYLLLILYVVNCPESTHRNWVGNDYNDIFEAENGCRLTESSILMYQRNEFNYYFR